MRIIHSVSIHCHGTAVTVEGPALLFLYFYSWRIINKLNYNSIVFTQIHYRRYNNYPWLWQIITQLVQKRNHFSFPSVICESQCDLEKVKSSPPNSDSSRSIFITLSSRSYPSPPHPRSSDSPPPQSDYIKPLSRTK